MHGRKGPAPRRLARECKGSAHFVVRILPAALEEIEWTMGCTMIIAAIIAAARAWNGPGVT